MTKAEAIWHANHVFNIVIERCINAQNLKDAREFDEAKQIVIEALQQEPKRGKWIPVTEELPTLNDDGLSDMVLLCWSDGQRTVGAYRGDRTFVGQAWPVAKDVSVTVTAWMPLPEPYKESDEQ